MTLNSYAAGAAAWMALGVIWGAVGLKAYQVQTADRAPVAPSVEPAPPPPIVVHRLVMSYEAEMPIDYPSAAVCEARRAFIAAELHRMGPVMGFNVEWVPIARCAPRQPGETP